MSNTLSRAVDRRSGLTRNAQPPYPLVERVPADPQASRSQWFVPASISERGDDGIALRLLKQAHAASADPVIDPSDPLQINGYAYADNNPVTMRDPDGLQPIECWEGSAVCHGGKIISAKPPEAGPAEPRAHRG